mgnify:FL=1
MHSYSCIDKASKNLKVDAKDKLDVGTNTSTESMWLAKDGVLSCGAGGMEATQNVVLEQATRALAGAAFLHNVIIGAH